MAAVELSKTLIIVIAVSGPVGCILLFFLIFKCLRRSRSSPLPPIQPLARQREFKYISSPFSRKSITSDQAGFYGSEKSSKPSLLPSYQTDDSCGAPSSSCQSLPTPPLPTNAVYWPGSQSAESGSDEQPPSFGETRPRQRSRTNSIPLTSSTSTHVSTRSSGHGAPHSRYNQVQVVLPTPLAPRLRHHMVADSSTIENKRGLVGVSDRWIRAPNRSTSWRAKSDQSFGDDSTERDFRLLPPPRRRRTQPLLVKEVPCYPHGSTMIEHDIPAPPPRTLMMENALSKRHGPVAQWPVRALGPSRYYDPYQPPSNTPIPPFPQSASH